MVIVWQTYWLGFCIRIFSTFQYFPTTSWTDFYFTQWKSRIQVRCIKKRQFRKSRILCPKETVRQAGQASLHCHPTAKTRWIQTGISIFNKGMVNWKLDHSVSAQTQVFIDQVQTLHSYNTSLFQELIWIIQDNFKTTVSQMVLHRFTNLAALHYSKW